MSVESPIPVDQLHDLPPRTWRGWWLAWPKWFRIGCWAALGLGCAHIALTVWVATGLIEPPEITRWRQRGAQLQYRDSQSSTWMTILWPPRVYGTIFEGLQGRSVKTVDYVLLTNPTDEVCQQCLDEFPNLKGLILQRGLSDPHLPSFPSAAKTTPVTL